MDDRIARAVNPRNFGKSLRHDKLGLWRFRVRDYRIICELGDKATVVTVLAVGHRSTVYD
jgi:mRNA interferase RelE/StbE